MNKKLLFSLLLAGTAFTGHADEARLLRFPATNGSDIVFSYAGDLYKAPLNGGEAQKLTSHIGYEMFARFSPDGKSIAFTGQYDGNTEVYLIPTDGGEPQRLTYTATNSRDDLGDRMGPNNIVMTWTPDGKNIVYRNRISDGFDGKLWSISKNGGMSEVIPLPEGGFCSYSPDGKKLAYNRVMREFRNWKYYRGGMADDIWIYDPAAKKVENITNNIAQDIIPMWIGEEIYFISDRDRTMNIFVYNIRTKQTEKVTHYTDYDVKFPSSNGQIIVYEHGGYLYKLDPKTRKSEKISITLTSDNIYARKEMKRVADNLTAASLSPDGHRLAVTARGEVFDVPAEKGVTRDITRTPGANEREGEWSPNGKQIAYISDRTGETEIWLQSVEGGDPIQRLTYTATNSRDDLGDRMGPNNIVMTWTPDGKNIVYRNRISDGFDGKLWSISKNGGMSEVIPLPEGGFCSYSPDGKKLAYNRVMREFRNWKYYRGGMADDIWIYDPAAKKVENITNNIAQDIIPMWIGEEIYFISDRDRTMNIFVYNIRTKQTEKVTHYTDYDVKFPSSNGQIIVYEHGGYLYKLDPKTRKSEKISITLTSDNIYARKEMKRVADNLTAASLSPDGHRLAVTARGEVFDVPAEKGVTRDITRTPGANEREGEWSPNGKQIAYISDRTGETEIWLQSVEGGDPIQLTQNNDTYIRQLMWSPDSKKILYTDRKNRIVEVDIASKAKRTVMQNPEGEFYEVNYSPDSQWITYTKSGANNMSVIYVYHLTSGKEYPVTEKWYNSSSPVFSTDGKYLIFNSERDFNPIYSQTEWNHAYNRMGGVYMAMLANDTPSPLLPSDEMVSIEQQATDAVNKKTEATNNAVKIDPEGLPGRLIKLPLQAGNYDNFYSDGKKVWYASGRSTKVYDLTEQKEETVAEGAYMDVAANHRKALFFKGNNLYICDFPCTKASLEENVNLDDMIAPIDYSQEWAQIFDETWRAFRDGFYLENMHGADWKGIKEKYAVLVPHAKTRLDLNYIIGEMIAELACGHAYVNPGEIKGPERIPMGLLGAELSRDKSGFYRIDKILPGAIYSQKLRSPLTEPGIGVKEGDYITAIDGISTATVDNIYSLLAGKANVLTELSINRTASSKGARKVVIKPLDNEYPLYHYNWVQNNIKKVEEATNGRVGYVYIPDMGPDGLNEFARYFYPQLDKEALIIDDRANGGGNVSPMIIERLLREPYRLTMRRGSTKIGTIPDATLVGPKVLLINKYSASDGDLFPWSFKANKIGKVIGTRTWGGIVGISGPLPYMDGTDVRVPFFTNYDAKTGQWIVENHGVDPDILIDNDPVKEQSGEDQQLNKAIEVILQELKDRKPLPSVPAPRTYKDLGVE